MSGEIAAVVLAAGLSRRMGVPKLVLPWSTTTVIGQVVSVLLEAGLGEILVVSGGSESAVIEALHGQAVQFVHNQHYPSGEMLSSVQAGLRAAMLGVAQSALIVLGDQPQLQVQVVAGLVQHWQESNAAILIPSYQLRRGHPWLIRRNLWLQILDLPAGETLRDFLKYNQESIHYLPVETDSILQDLDTPEDYDRQRPK
jgi:molybdenum cofactor cytidylyltransferase